MANPMSGVGRLLAEALMIAPVLVLGLAWAAVTLAGLLDPTLVELHRSWIEELMTLLLFGCLACFVGGVILFLLTRGSKPGDSG